MMPTLPSSSGKPAGRPASRAAVLGFTLTELLIVMGIAGILAAATLPSLSAFSANQRSKNAASTLLIGLVDARSTAIRLGSNVTFSPYQNSTTWNSGWQIVDSSNNIVGQQAFSSVTITGPGSVVYLSSGRINATTTPSFLVQPVSPGTSEWCVSIDPGGRPYIKQATSC